ncbi:MAG: RpiB/LacA/LacB family sugar-phosphate isomerase [Planctomycetaceae bacterium]|nr:RpiB/LacA/LacB family sugar-phosphate isomerase [Planctomycetaceae bacterium]
MKIAIAYNNTGARIAEGINGLVIQLGHSSTFYKVADDEFGCTDVLYEAGLELLSNNVDRIIIICGSGINTSMIANKIKGLYAAVCYEALEAHIAREDYDTNVLCLSDSWLDPQTAHAIVKEWLGTQFEHKNRCDRALRKIKSIEDSGYPQG